MKLLEKLGNIFKKGLKADEVYIGTLYYDVIDHSDPHWGEGVTKYMSTGRIIAAVKNEEGVFVNLETGEPLQGYEDLCVDGSGEPALTYAAEYEKQEGKKARKKVTKEAAIKYAKGLMEKKRQQEIAEAEARESAEELNTIS